MWLQKKYIGSSLAFNKVVRQDCFLILNVNVKRTVDIIEESYEKLFALQQSNGD